MEIDIITCITKNSSDYAELLRNSCEYFSSKEHKLNWKFVESDEPERYPEGWGKLTTTGYHKQNSFRHSMALNLIQDYITSEYAIIADADIAILYPNWDKVVINHLNTGLACWGFEYVDIINQRYKYFPNLFFFCFRSEILKNIRLDFAPKLKDSGTSTFKYRIPNKREAELFGRNKGDIIKLDTGWKLPLLIKAQGYNWGYLKGYSVLDTENILLPFASARSKRKCQMKPEHMCEWHYKNKLFATHKQASRVHNLKESEWGKRWKARIDLYTKKKFGVVF